MDCSVQCVQMKRRGAVLYQSPTNVKLDGVKYHTLSHSAWSGEVRTASAFVLGAFLCRLCVHVSTCVGEGIC